MVSGESTPDTPAGATAIDWGGVRIDGRASQPDALQIAAPNPIRRLRSYMTTRTSVGERR